MKGKLIGKYMFNFGIRGAQLNGTFLHVFMNSEPE
jgi:hypothetical protein